MDINNKKVSTEFLEMILENGCKYLDVSLAVTLEDNINIERSELTQLDVSSYSCNKITTTQIQISQQNWNNFFSNISH